MAVFRQTSWPIFDQNFGRFSAKILVRFRPKFWSVFGQNLGRFPTKKTLNWIAPMGLGECPSDGTLAFAIFFGEPSKSSREAFPNLRAKPFIFCRKLKSESKIGHGFMVENRPKKFDAEEPRLRARSHSVPPWSVFGHDFWSVFGHDFGPQTCDRNWQTPGPKSENGLAEIRKRPSEFSENAKAKIQKLTFFVSEIGQGFGRNLTKILAEI